MLASIIIPALDEAHTIVDVLDRCLRLPFEKEIIVVDNNSRDDTCQMVRDFILDNACESTISLIRQSKRGKGAALQKGVESAHGDAIVFQDADCEYDPANIAALVGQLGSYDVVFGSRLGRLYAISPSAFIANKILLTLVNRRFSVSLSDIFTGQRAFRRDVLDRIGISSTGFDVETELTIKTLSMGYRWTEVDVSYSPRDRKAGKKIGAFSFLAILCRYLLLAMKMPRFLYSLPERSHGAIKQPNS